MLGAVSKNRPEAERSTGPQTWQVPKGVQGGGPPALARFRDFVSKSRPQLLRAMHQLWENISTSDKVAGSAIDVIRNQASVSPLFFPVFFFFPQTNDACHVFGQLPGTSAKPKP